MPSQTTRIDVAPPFELRLCLFGHGWVSLAPHDWGAARERLDTALRLGSTVVDAALHQTGAGRLALRLESRRRLTGAQLAAARRQIAHMLRLDDDLSAFHARCRDDPSLAWVARRGGGRLMRSTTVFEDLMKLLFTTNTTWAGTAAMTRKLVDALGANAPSGRRAFPTPRRCVQQARFYRDVVRAGYRAEAAVRLARAFAGGELDDATFLGDQTSDRLWRRLTALHGFGPYAAGQAMRLCGHYDRLALDSWCRARLAELDGRPGPPSDRAVARRFARFAPFEGLAMWCRLTAQWHGEG